MSEELARIHQPAAEISEDALKRDLSAKNYHVFWVKPKAGLQSLLNIGRRKRISSTEFLLFNHEFATLIKAGLPVLQGIEILLELRRTLDICKQRRDRLALAV